MSGRGAFAVFPAFAVVARLAVAAVRPAGGAGRAPEESAHAACAQRSPARAISSPGRTADAQTPQVVAYFAVIGTGTG
jgi:hypothetical protein